MSYPWIQHCRRKSDLYLLDKQKAKNKGKCVIKPLGGNLFILPQGSILGPVSFIIFQCDLFFIMGETDFASHAMIVRLIEQQILLMKLFNH